MALNPIDAICIACELQFQSSFEVLGMTHPKTDTGSTAPTELSQLIAKKELDTLAVSHIQGQFLN